MTPNKKQTEAGRLRKLFADAEEKMLAYMKDQLAQGAPDDYGCGERKLAEIQNVLAELDRRVSVLRGSTKTLTDKLLEDAYDSGALEFQKDLHAPGERFLRTIPESRAKSILQLIRETDAKFNAQASWILRDVEDAYRAIIGEVVALQATGVTTTTESIQAALNRFADAGISSFVDKAGRSWQMDSYAEMAVRTSMMNAAVGGYTDEAMANGERLVIVSDHTDECPLCAKWERKVLALIPEALNDPGCDGFTLEDAVNAGLFHPNCLHAVTVYVHGLTDRSGSKDGLPRTAADDEKGYKLSQKQRYYERNVRKWRRRQAAAMTPEAEREAKAYVDRWESALRAFVDDNDLKRKYWREGERVKLSAEALKLKPIKLKPLKG